MTVELESQGPAPSQHLEMPGPSRDTLALSQELATARQDAHRNVSLQVRPAPGLSCISQHIAATSFWKIMFVEVGMLICQWMKQVEKTGHDGIVVLCFGGT